jgi:hypothetical protein
MGKWCCRLQGDRFKFTAGQASSGTLAPSASSAVQNIIILLLGIVPGCSMPERLETGYGRPEGFGYGGSVNGTAVLADMFRQSGNKVGTWRVLSPRLERADVIVWFPDDYAPPSPKVRDYLQEWLTREPYRTLVFVGRHYEAESAYYKAVGGKAPAEPLKPRRAGKAKQKSRSGGSEESEKEHTPVAPEPDESNTPIAAEAVEVATPAITATDAGWFRFTPGDERSARPLKGPWSEGIDADAADVVLTGKFVPRVPGEALLASGDEVIAFKAPMRDSEMILVQNGSFLLNFSLVNHEHRKLAARLIETVEANSGEETTVVFLESDEDGLEILDRDPMATVPPGPDDQAPLSYVLYHAIALGVIAVFAAWSIFGRPRRVARQSRSDFGRHVYWLGQLLEKTGDTAYCKSRLMQYQQSVRRDAAGSAGAGAKGDREGQGARRRTES